MKAAADVTNVPAGWKPDLTFVKRQVHFTEPPNESENPFVRISVEQNMVDLDPGENGRLLSDINLEVRVDGVGMLNLGPIFLDADLENAKQVVEVEFKAKGQTADGHERSPVRFSWRFDDQAEPRYWMIFTGQPDFMPKFEYQVRVIVKGSIFTKGMEWIGPWQESGTNGPLMVSVPTPEDEGVQMRSLWLPGTIQARPETAPALGPPSAPAAPPRIPAHASSTPPRVPAQASGPPPREKHPAYAGARDVGGWTTLPDTSDWTSLNRPAETSRHGPQRKLERSTHTSAGSRERK